MKEKYNLEYKSEINNTFLKTVSAFSNFGEGEIKFGIDDDGTVCGIDKPKDACIVIENKINDSISPKPDFSLSINSKSKVVSLNVKEGKYKPYLYKGKAYRRSDTSTVEVDQIELKRLVLEGSNLYYEGLPANKEKLTFKYLEKEFKERIGIAELSHDVLQTLGFYTGDSKWNNAAELFADENNFYGIDMVRFGDEINLILDRETISGISILEQYERAISLIKKYYQYEEIKGVNRKKKELIPEIAFREAVANALVHRIWDINSHIRISMFNDRVEITSPGGLPKGITEEEYLYGDISNLRNPIIGNIFFRLHYIEKFGTGIKRIIESYDGYAKQPNFRVTDNTITVVLPIVINNYDINAIEKKVICLLENMGSMSSPEIAEKLGFSKDKTIRLMNKLIEKNYVKKTGKGRATKYFTRFF